MAKNCLKKADFWWKIKPPSFELYNASCPIFSSKYSCPWNKRSLVAIDNLAKSRFLNQTRNSHIYFLGDSLTKGHFISFACILWSHVVDFDVFWPSAPNSVKGPNPVGKGSNLGNSKIYLDNGLILHFTTILTFNRNQLAEVKPNSTVVINFAMWYKKEDFDTMLIDTAELSKLSTTDEFSSLKFIWRETTSGHFPKVQLPGSANSILYPCVSDSRHDEFERIFHRQSEIAISGSSNFRLIPTIHSSQDQWDMHIGTLPIVSDPPESKMTGVLHDCANWCLPGVPDTWSRDLMSMML